MIPRPITAQPLTRNEFEKCSLWLESIAENLGYLVDFAAKNDPWRAVQVFRDCVDAANYLYSLPDLFAPRVWRILEQYAEPGDVMSAVRRGCTNAHNMAFRLAPKMTGAILAADPKALDHVKAMKPRSGVLMTDDTWPKARWPAVRKAIQGFPTFDAKALALRIKAERQRCLTRWARDTSKGDKDSTSDDPNVRHSDDFRSVVWFGTSYTFTRNQAACVKVLWTAWKAGTPELEGLTVVTQADVSQTRLSDVFKAKGKMHLAWGTMIGQGRTKGAYRLSEPATVAKSAVKPRRKESRKSPRKTPR